MVSLQIWNKKIKQPKKKIICEQFIDNTDLCRNCSIINFYNKDLWFALNLLVLEELSTLNIKLSSEIFISLTRLSDFFVLSIVKLSKEWLETELEELKLGLILLWKLRPSGDILFSLTSKYFSVHRCFSKDWSKNKISNM